MKLHHLLVVACLLGVTSAFAATPAEDEAQINRLAAKMRTTAEQHGARASAAEQVAVDAGTRLSALADANAKLALEVDRLHAQLAKAPGATPSKVYVVPAGGDIAAALAKAKPGDAVNVEPGAITAGFVVPEGVTLDLTGSTFDGKGAKAIGLVRLAKNATIIGGTIRNFAAENERNKTTVIIAGDNATLRGTTLQDWTAGCPISWNLVDRPSFIDVTIRNIAGSAYLGGGGGDDGDKTVVGPLFENCTIADWNQGTEGGESGIGVNKITRTTGTTFRNCTFEGGRGRAIWLDINNRKFLIEGNTFRNLKPARHVWDPIGVCIELNPGDGGVIQNNTFEGFTKAATVSIEESSDIVVRNNKQNPDAFGEVRNMRNPKRDSGNRTYGYWVTENGKRVQKYVEVELKNVLFENNAGGKWTHLSIPKDFGPDPDALLKAQNVVYRNNK
ncbi:MAG TPA: right-handed parallel beta-helix repeat-containing protein [Tepidisphaeraceae bacterium]|jgi:hypothetical protein|nr:right-handed parallel beta-helix repeat-containing protein [Tepidisphaeraceae bacterium]